MGWTFKTNDGVDKAAADITNPPGSEVPNGLFSQPNTQSAAVNNTNSASFGSITVTGDGNTPMLITVTGYAPYISVGTGPHFDFKLWDGAIGGTQIAGQQFFSSVTGASAGGMHFIARVAAFSGSKTFNLACISGANVTITNQASATLLTVIRATWAG